jgi:hypothetical protein
MPCSAVACSWTHLQIKLEASFVILDCQSRILACLVKTSNVTYSPDRSHVIPCIIAYDTIADRQQCSA